MGDYYTWAEFQAAVHELLPLEKTRLIQGDNGTFLNRTIRQAVIDLQTFIPVYRKNHETLYLPESLVADGAASRGVLPPQAEVQDVFLVDTVKNVRFPLAEFPWADRFELTSEQVLLSGNNGFFSIDDAGYTFYAYPEVTEGWMLSMNWDGLKIDFKDDEEVPFCEGAVGAAAEWVEGKMARKIDQNLNMYMSYFHPRDGSYITKRKNLFLTAKERTRIKR